MVTSEYFLICGLGSLGQQCVLALNAFGVKVVAIEKIPMASYEIPSVPDLLDELVIGDCSYFPLLEKVNLLCCRAALLVTHNEEVNIQTALLIRQLNPTTRLVVRSSQMNLNQLLSEQLGNFIAYEPLDLPANAFALAALGNETLGFFELDRQWLRVIQTQLTPDHPWLQNQRLHDLHGRTRRILTLQKGHRDRLPAFHQWDGEQKLQLDDSLVYVELVDSLTLKIQPLPLAAPPVAEPRKLRKKKSFLTGIQLKKWQQLTMAIQARPIILFAGLAISGLLLLGTMLFYLTLTEVGILGSFYRTFVLLLGGYGDLFDEIQNAKHHRWILEPLSLLLTLAGIAFVGMLYALLTENLLAAKFIFARKHLPIPRQNHVVILGLGRVGQRVARLLKTWKQPTVGINLKSDFDPRILPDIPVLTQSLEESFIKANLAMANSVVVVTDDDMLNLELALITKKMNPQANLVIRTAKEGLSHSLMSLLPRAQVLDTYRLAAEVFVGVAFGENILNLFRLYDQTILVTEYQIESQDTLSGLLLSEIAYGYGVVPLWHRSPHQPALLFPSDDVVLREGDRLIILATIEGLRKIEVRDLNPKTWCIRVKRVFNQDSAFERANTISRISGCSLHQARDLMNSIPKTLSTPLYQPQAQRLVRALKKMQILAGLITIQES